MRVDCKTIKEQAIEYAKKHKKQIAYKFIDDNRYKSEDVPVSIFMCGSPGAGKTEFSKNIIKNLKQQIVRIDGDEIREKLPGYTGANSVLFQSAVSIIVDKIHDIVLAKQHSFILDGTFSKYTKARENILRSLKRYRTVYIFYIYQDPIVAWKFTKMREKLEGRNIPKESFINHFFGAIETINNVNKEFKGQVMIYFVKKNLEFNTVDEITRIISSRHKVDDLIGTTYTKQELTALL